MTRIIIPEEPVGYRCLEGSAIRAPAVSTALPLPVAARVNGLLARGASLIFEQAWPASVTAINTRIYHRRAVNAKRLFVIALIEKASEGTGTITVTPAGGVAVSRTTEETGATSLWGSPDWQAWITAIPLVSTGLQYHTLVTSNLIVRYIGFWELTRDELSTLSDTMIALSSGAYAGLEAGRWIAAGANASVADILAAIGSAEDATKRHGGGVVFPDSTPWTMTGKTETNIADGSLGTLGFYFPFAARKVHASTTYVHNEVRIRAKTSAVGITGTFKFYSNVTGDVVSFTGITNSWAWLAPDAGALLHVAAAADHLIPKGLTSDNAGVLSIASIQFLE